MPIDLSELDALAEKATPGPWSFEDDAIVTDDPIEQNMERNLIADARYFTIPRHAENAALIVALVNAWPTLRSELIAAREEKRKLIRERTDRDYMIEALVNMLGPNGLTVWRMWQEKRVCRVHFDWGPSGMAMTGEERAQVILDVEAAPKTLIENIDEDLAKLPAPPATGEEG